MLQQTSTQTLLQVVNDMEASAEVAELVYTDSTQPGISRIRRGKGFVYFIDKLKITDEKTLTRIRSLVIPPAWKNVWICADHRGHLQATGTDARNRKQYRYHPHWQHVRNHAKYSTLLEFGEALPQIRNRLEKDIAQKELTEQMVLALVIRLMEETYMRIGNSYYEKINGSHGITTLKDKHVQIEGSDITFSFNGKKGISHTINLHSRKLARLVRQCRDIPGKELFQYIAPDGSRRKVDSGMVNNYIKMISQKQFTAKDFRTWAGSVNALCKILEMQKSGIEINQRTAINEVIDYVSNKLGNTRAVCKKYYIHPTILDLLSENKLPEFNGTVNQKNKSSLSPVENWLIKILKSKKKIILEVK